MHGLVRSQERHPGHPGRVVNFFVSIGIQHLEDLFSLVAMKASAQGLHMVSLTKWMFRKINIIFRTLSLRVAMPFMQGCDLLNPTSCRINTDGKMWMFEWICSIHCVIQFGIQRMSKHFSSIIHRPSNLCMHIWCFP